MFKKIILAVDGSEHATKAAAIAGEMSARFAAQLVVLHVMKRLGSDRVPPDLMELARIEHINVTEADALRSVAEEIVTRAKDTAAHAGAANIATVIEHGDPAERVISYCADNQGDLIEADVLIYGTGFKTNPFLLDIDVVGENGKTIQEHWSQGATAYMGVSTHGFPNLHLLYGPNTNLGHTSVIIMFEAQVAYIIRAMEYLEANSKQSMMVKREAEISFNLELQQRLHKMAFNEVEDSWYKDGDRITNNWAGGTREYCRRLNSVDWESYHLV